MKQRLQTETFDSRQPVIIRRAVRINGRDYAPGETLHWKRMSLGHRVISNLFSSGKAGHAVVDEKPAVKVSRPKKERVAPTPAPEPVEQIAETTETTETAVSGDE